MSLTIKHLNSDTSFLLTFTPTASFPPSPFFCQPNNYTILLDPWLVGPSNVFHSKFSTARHKILPCISSLAELPEPDLVVISQSKSDHCHKQTLMQLPASGGKTIILAEPAAAKVIRGWKYFAPEKVVTLPRWEDPRSRKTKAGENMHTISIPPQIEDGAAGEVTIANIVQKGDLTGLHNAIGITYRSPTTFDQSNSSPDTPPLTPASICSSFSTASHPSHHKSRPLSIIYSPHGLPYKYVLPYVSTHLLPLSALPLTALLHCFDSVQNTWYLGGNICSGFPGGLEIAQNLLARVWVSAHDGDKEVKGLANGKLEVRKYDQSEVESVVSPRSDKFPSNGRVGTEAVVLGVGEEVHIPGGVGELRFEGGLERFKTEEMYLRLDFDQESPSSLNWDDMAETPSFEFSVHG